ncbi:MAG: FliA/WhiG family RNA polymerase sigma factor [Ignavibacteriae bacterium]|nr:FliA/WhiG family RNA polymerase sigma factor [Ignavibacteriota bacterium]
MDNIDKIWNEYLQNPNQELRGELFIQYSWIVNYVLSKLKVPDNSILERGDLVNIGMIGLSESIDRFDIEKNVKFESYAITRVRGTIQDELRKLDWLSRTARKKVNSINKLKDETLKENGIEVTDEEIIRKLGLTSDQYNSYLQAMEASRNTLSFVDSSTESDSEGYSLVDNIAYDDESNQLEGMIESEKIEYLTNYLKDLPEKKRLVIALYYYENLTFKEIGKLIDVTEGRVSQIHSEVIKELKVKINKYENA